MKLFLREHFLLICVQFIQAGVIFLVLWLGGFRNISALAYAIFLQIFFLIAYLTYHYLGRRHYYAKLEEGITKLEESLEKTDRSPAAMHLDSMLKQQYQLYAKKIREAEERQEEHLEFIDRWVHQMKTPLSVIELTAQNVDEPDSSNIREETERIKSGLNTVLYMARLRNIEHDFRIRPVELAKVVKEVNAENKRFYIRNSVYPRLDEKQADITVESDEKWIFFILEQLIQNAVKYSAGKSSHIDIRIYKRGSSAVLEVLDEGIGIPAEDRRRIFHKFHTGTNGRKYRESTGMGLYLVKEVCKRLGHKVEMDSEVGEGSSFRIVFSPTQTLHQCKVSER
ncbi:sensor histidine kinase [Aciduricibacillus chroicocephali]|uniref:histidine kinase n=1 Tax=Aciduricibacillus chroicocephali TaxID=3054939 RepID=A0ABY9KXV2_9BACI|nr:sensor histidine kinase [Bacillaceae bacterium 44XB]